MTTISYNPWSEIDSVQRQINRVLNEVLVPNTVSSGNYSKYPVAELTETKEVLILKLEVPGIQPGNIDIEATAKSISIKGDRTPEVEAENTGNIRSEFLYGSFHRVISLPIRIQNTEVKAEYKNGILHLTLPKADEEKNKVVKVNLPGE